MARLKKCVCCGEAIETNEVSVAYKKGYAHQRCFNASIKALTKDKSEKLEKKTQSKKTKTSKPTIEVKDAVSEEEHKEKIQYYGYLRQLLDVEKLPAKIYVVSEDYIKKYAFTYLSMYQTLVYMNEILEKELDGDIVGLIKYYHTDAELFYKQLNDIDEHNKDVNISDMYVEKTVPYHFRKRNYTKQVDILSIGQGVSEC